MSKPRLEDQIKSLEEQVRQLNRHDCDKHAEDWHGQIHCGKCGRLIR